MDEEDLESQRDEILALKSIYNRQELKTKNDNQGIFTAHVQSPNETIELVLSDDTNIPNSLKHLYIKEGKEVKYHVKHMPPIVMKFEYPPSYPSLIHPVLSLSCIWLPDHLLQDVKQHLIDEWNDVKDVILFSWTSFLVNEIWDYLQLPDKFFCPGLFSTDIVGQICIYDFERRFFVFSQSPHKCNVCLDEFKGSLCIQFLPCDHVYCKVCMKSYFEVLINSGDVNQMLCPDDKCESIALPTQVKELVDTDLYEKYERFLLQRTLDQMTDVVRCPRKFCQNSVLKDEDSNMAQCNSCNFIFCVLCDRTWHGQHTPCALQSARYLEMYEKWKNANEGEREAMYKMYGRAKVLRIVADIESEEWLKNNSKQCPHCFTQLQLGVGCNKIKCSVCSKYMCWLCGHGINQGDPYSHYRPGGPCENRLFENTALHDEEEYFEFNDGLDDDFDDWIEIVFQDN